MIVRLCVYTDRLNDETTDHTITFTPTDKWEHCTRQTDNVECEIGYDICKHSTRPHSNAVTLSRQSSMSQSSMSLTNSKAPSDQLYIGTLYDDIMIQNHCRHLSMERAHES